MAINVCGQHNGGLLPYIYTVAPILLPSENPFQCHEEVLSLQPIIPPKRFDIFPPLTGGCPEGLIDAFRFFFCGVIMMIYRSIILRTTIRVDRGCSRCRLRRFDEPF